MASSGAAPRPTSARAQAMVAMLMAMLMAMVYAAYMGLEQMGLGGGPLLQEEGRLPRDEALLQEEGRSCSRRVALAVGGAPPPGDGAPAPGGGDPPLAGGAPPAGLGPSAPDPSAPDPFMLLRSGEMGDHLREVCGALPRTTRNCSHAVVSF